MNESLKYYPPAKIQNILEGHGTKNSILAEGEEPQAMLERVTGTIFSVEEKFGTPTEQIEELKYTFIRHFIARNFTPGIPTLTNAGRPGYESSTLSSCIVVPVDLREKEEATEKIKAHYAQNMGSGFNFTEYEDPVGMLHWINDLSRRETEAGKYTRRIANMGTLHITHPKILEFIRAKVNDRSLLHFNTSVEVNDGFMEAALTGSQFQLADGSFIEASSLLQEIAEAAWQCGEPGLINFDRMNAHNPLGNISAYDCSPPCGEMGLAPGETCQFGYINLANYIDEDGIKTEDLAVLVKFAVRVLDNAIECGGENQPSLEGQEMSRLKRKIGISVVGLADTLIKAGVPYDSEAGRQLARDMVSFINYQAKVASVELAQERGSCEAMNLTEDNLYYSGYIAERFACQPTNTVSNQQWNELDEKVRTTGMLRNIHHTALPPGGRASMVLGVNHSIEPLFSPTNLNVDTTNLVLQLIADSLQEPEAGLEIQVLFNQAVKEGTFQRLPGMPLTKRLLRTAVEISIEDHVKMASALAGVNGVSDESASKTVNMFQEASPDDVLGVYLLAHQEGLKNISVYRDGSLDNQPRKL